MVVQSTGNVGIGETTPAYQLHVSGAGDIKIEDNAGGSAHLHMASSTGGLRDSEWRLKTQGSTDEFTFDHRYTANDGSNDVVGNGTVLTLKSDANVDVTNDVVANNAKLKAIAESNTDTAVDVFVYDTRKDSDGGAWRKRTQHTSWYNETLNTSTRGARKEFPSVAVIVAEAAQVTIYDGDDPDMPMWMVFNSGNYYFIGPTNRAKTSAHMLNGILCVGTRDNSAWMAYISFIDDTARQYSSVPSEKRNYLVPILNRNDVNSSAVQNGVSEYTIVNDNINDVAMTILPNAPIDADTGLPVPTIAVATDGGVSVIKDDGTVVDITSTRLELLITVLGL